MKKLVIFLFFLNSFAWAQYTPTPNIGMEIPSNGSSNWNIPLNFNFNKLDQYLSGGLALPALSVSGNVIVGGSVQAGSFIGSGGAGIATATAGLQWSPVYYSSSPSGTSFSGVTPFTGLVKYSATGPPSQAVIGDVNLLLLTGTNCGISGNVYSPFVGGCINGGGNSITSLTGDVTGTGPGATATQVIGISHVSSGVLGAANGGTGASTLPSGLLRGNGTGSVTQGTAVDIDNALGYTPAIAPNYTNDFTACYLFTETATSGGSLIDHCGSNNGTVGTLAPVSTGTGWQFSLATTSPVVLPAALNSTKTFYFAILNPPAVGGGWATTPAANTLLGNTVNGNLHIFNTNQFTEQQTFSSFSTWQNSAFITQIPDVFSGVTILTLVCGTQDAMYVNGHLVQNATTGDSCGRMASGSFEIGGSSDNAGFVSYSTFYDMRFSNNAHTAAQVAQNVNAMSYELTGRGVLLIPNRYIYPTQQLFFAGDSITCGVGSTGSPGCVNGTPYSPGTTSTGAYPAILTLDQTFGITNFGVPNAIIQQQVSAAPFLYAPLCSTQNGSTIASIFEGTNNFTAQWSNTPAQVWAYAVGWNTIMKQAGCKTIFISMLSRGGTAWGSTTYETYRYEYTALARANWKQAGFDAFVDMDSDPFLGCTGCNANLTYFVSDETHPTNAGQNELKLPIQATINYLSAGSTPNNPNPTIITASTYTWAYEDGGRVFNTISNNINTTLLSAQWQTGRIIQACNTSTSGTNTLTITAPSDYPFNNVSGDTTVTVANNTCQRFQSTYVQGGATNGDFWRLIQ